MQPIDALTLKHLAGELDVKLADGKINKIQQASHHELLIHWWVGGDAGRQKLYVSIDPAYAFCALAQDTSFLSFPETAPNFCMVLRKHLTGAKVLKINTLPNERVLTIHLNNFNELGQNVDYALEIELMGKHSNIILVDKNAGMIMGCAHGVSEAMSRLREISVGYPYVPPPVQEKPAFWQIQQSTVEGVITEAIAQNQDPVAAFVSTFSGVGKAVVADCWSVSGTAAGFYQTLIELYRGESLYPAISQTGDYFSLLPQHAEEPGWRAQKNLNEMVSAFYLSHLTQQQLKLQTHRYLQILLNQKKKLNQRLNELDKTDEAEMALLKLKGDLLTVYAGSADFSESETIRKTFVELENWETGAPLKIELDPTLSLNQNAQLYFRRFKKGQTRLKLAKELRDELVFKLEYLDEIRERLSLALSPDDLPPIMEELIAQGWMKPPVTLKKNRQPVLSEPLKLISSDGLTILVGKNGLQNEQLVKKQAHPDDLWLHTHLIPGSHVLIKSNRQAVPNQTLLEAAQLAAYFSKARSSVNVPVIYTQSRYVKSIPNSYPGHVNYSQEQAINVNPKNSI